MLNKTSVFILHCYLLFVCKVKPQLQPEKKVQKMRNLDNVCTSFVMYGNDAPNVLHLFIFN